MIPFAKNIIFCSLGNAHYAQTNSKVTLLSHSVIDMEDALTQYKIKNNASNYNALKFQRMMVLRHLTEISNIVKATVTVNPENAALIITCSGFEVK